MFSQHFTTRLLFASAVALLGACGETQSNSPYSTTTTTMAPVETAASPAPAAQVRQAPPVVMLSEDAISQIASVRCARENACGNIGPGHAFPSFDACASDVRRENRQRLSGNVCMNGVDPYALGECVDDTRNQQCGEPGSLSSPPSCASERICK